MWVRLREPAREVKAVGCWGPSVVCRGEEGKGCYWSMVRPWSIPERCGGYGTDPELGAGDEKSRTVLPHPPATLERNPQLSLATRMDDWTSLAQYKRKPEPGKNTGLGYHFLLQGIFLILFLFWHV